MKVAADFRLIARNALRGKWGLAVVACLIATMLGGTGANGLEVNFHNDAHHGNVSLDYAGTTIISTHGFNHELGALFFGGAVYVFLLILLMGALYFILSSVVSIGYARFHLEIVDKAEPSIGTLFTYFSHWKTMALARLLQIVYITLWSLLLVIPGIMAAYSYSLTKYILAEQPELTATEAIQRSKNLMYGNRLRLFYLQISFIGWTILSALTLGIGNLFLTPYMETATAAFYREITGSWESEIIIEFE